MKKIFSTLFFAVAFFAAANAQNTGSDYQTAVGIKFYPTGISVKSFVNPNAAIEGLGYFSSDGFRITGLYELHYKIEGVPGLKWYVGPGAHIEFWNTSWQTKYPGYSSTGIGIDGVLGLDYKFSGVPLNMSVDWQPSFNFVGYNYFEGGWGGLGIRYTF